MVKNGKASPWIRGGGTAIAVTERSKCNKFYGSTSQPPFKGEQALS